MDTLDAVEAGAHLAFHLACSREHEVHSRKPVRHTAPGLGERQHAFPLDEASDEADDDGAGRQA